jgi:hypothetical protein
METESNGQQTECTLSLVQNSTPASAVSCSIKERRYWQFKENQTHPVPCGSNGKIKYVYIYRCMPFCCEYQYKQLHHQLHTFRVEYMLLWVQFVGVCYHRSAVKFVCCNCCCLPEFHMKRFDQLMSMWVSLKEQTNTLPFFSSF